MTLHPERQSFQTLQEQKSVEWTQCRPHSSQCFHSRLHRESKITEGLVETNAMIALRGLGHARKIAVVPGELSGLDQSATD